MKVSVIIPTLNEEKRIGLLLDSLKKQTVKPYEVIIVDGGSTDNTLDICETKSISDKATGYPATNLYEKLGMKVGAARNYGARMAEGDILAFIDADCVLDRHWIQGIIEGFKYKQVIGMIGATFPDSKRKHHQWMYRLRRGGQKLSLAMWLPFDPGLNCAYRAEVFRKTKGFDPTRRYNEGAKFSMDIRKHGDIVFNQGMIAKASTRRMDKKSYGYLAVWYSINWVRMLLDVPMMEYPIVR